MAKTKIAVLVSGGGTNLQALIDAQFNSRLLKLNDDADIIEELKGLTPEQLKALIALVKNA